MIAPRHPSRPSVPTGLSGAAYLTTILVLLPVAAVADMPGQQRTQPLSPPAHTLHYGLWSQRAPATQVFVASRRLSREFDSEPNMTADVEEQSITSVTTDIHPKSGVMPKDVAAKKMAELASVSYPPVALRDWCPLEYCWDAPVLCHEPLYFEEVNLERHGYGPKGLRLVQPVISGAHFFATVPTLPYKIVAEPPGHPVSTLGHYRPGSCVPYRPNYPPLSLRGGLAEAGLAVGLVFLIP